MEVLIIEDEKPASDKLKRMLRTIDSDINIIAVLESVEQSGNWFLENNPPDLVFMDIQLDDGTCFEIFESIRINTPVIFTTAYDEYALDAFKVNSVDYLLKPVRQDALEKAIAKYKQLHPGKTVHHNIEQLIQQFKPSRRERLLLKIGSHYKSIQISDILYFQIRERSVFINTGSNCDYAVDFSLEQAEEMIDKERFFRINRNFIVNISAIKDIVAYSSSRLKLVLKNHPEGEEVIISRERVGDFKKWMDR